MEGHRGTPKSRARDRPSSILCLGTCFLVGRAGTRRRRGLHGIIGLRYVAWISRRSHICVISCIWTRPTQASFRSLVSSQSNYLNAAWTVCLRGSYLLYHAFGSWPVVIAPPDADRVHGWLITPHEATQFQSRGTNNSFKVCSIH